ncbi:amidohydrolase family protein [Alicyclobacillus sp. ALC3]|uniref:amidohydrolase family protein n=1 Tax=Alicyclobacillus sp. ALC3 TaxID=2796143 RepID=UPI002377E77B|nr:amidohydrolase family protein [Alicyclobacillus sp. ALC3]WDL97572.1 amidohydrolase [Alicyclobacillus sp. ALC3]
MIIDVHAHYLDPAVVKAIVAGEFAPDLSYDRERGGFVFPSVETRPTPRGMTDLETRLRHMDEAGVDMQVLSTWLDMLGADLPEATARAFHRAVNQGLATAVRSNPDRFRFLASVPLPYGELAAKELTISVEEDGAVGALIGTRVGGLWLDDPAFDPFWRAAEKLAVPVMLHPLTRAIMPPLQDYYLSNLLGNPMDTTVAASRLIMAGVMDRFPNLTIVLVHGGGYLPYAVGRLDHGHQVRPEAKSVRMLPSSYLHRFAYDHIVFDAGILAGLAERVGRDRMVIGSDYPFDMEPRDLLGLAEAGLGPEAGQRLGDNALRIFRRITG